MALGQAGRRWDAALREYVVPPPLAVCGSQRPCCRCSPARGSRRALGRGWGFAGGARMCLRSGEGPEGGGTKGKDGGRGYLPTPSGRGG